jgi:2,4-dienoyl-CoA reductase-like NADH-dependent reductase (Old Yellow Enzyme family)
MMTPSHIASSPATLSWVDSVLFSPVCLGNFQLPNRIVMAPMTREFAPNGLLDPQAPAYYRRRVEGGTALIVTEGTTVPHPVAHHTNTVPHFFGEEAVVRWREVADAVHGAGGRIFPQLWHCGIGRHRLETINPEELSIGPSKVGKEPMREMTQGDIDVVVEAFARGADTAKSAGFDGVAIHGAHGYLIDAFFWGRTNRRSDGYGGGLAQRTRFGVELVQEIRRRVGPGFPIMLRFSQWKGFHYDAKVATTPIELEDWLLPLADAGVDIFDASTRRFWLPEFEGSSLNLAGWAKKITGKLAMTVGSVGLEGPLDGLRVTEMSKTQVSISNLLAVERMLSEGEVDLVGVGRILLANPDWANLIKRGELDRIRPYDPKLTALALEPSTLAAESSVLGRGS